MKKLDDWEVDFDEQDELTNCDDIFADDGVCDGQVKFTENYEADLSPAGSTIDVNERSDELSNPEGSASEGFRVERHANREINKMSDFDDAIAKAVSNIPECLAGGVVDMDSGMLVGVKTVDSHPQEVLDMLAAATQDLFQGQNVVTIENTFKKARGLELDDYHYFKEIIVNSENLIHVFIRAKQQPQFVMTFVCRLSANLGMVLTKARAQVPVLEAAI
ncbi:hypothetical protein [Marinobacter salexigens]|uniref:hypothetical protein n=1 Tax=Marinobacter salexigens TaxID=1925763 RepID=UPI0019611EC9|nr:hypothetical protein [Marinobacter salexigens]